MKKHSLILAILLSAAFVGFTGQSIAHSGASGIVKERMEAMKTLADHARNVGDMLKRKTPFDLSVVEAASSAFISHGERMPALFPDTKKSRNGPKTEALPAIWSNWADFTKIAAQFTEDSRVMSSLVEELGNKSLSATDQNRAVRAAFFKASRNCSGCHERFRLEQN